MTSKSSITTETEVHGQSLQRPEGGWKIQRVTTHPGEVLEQDFLIPLGMSVHRLALALRVPSTRMQEIVKGRRAVSPDTALRLARFFGSSPEFWLGLQQTHDLTKARQAAGTSIEHDVQPLRVAS